MHSFPYGKPCGNCDDMGICFRVVKTNCILGSGFLLPESRNSDLNWDFRDRMVARILVFATIDAS
jgi:hypothetical protein